MRETAQLAEAIIEKITYLNGIDSSSKHLVSSMLEDLTNTKEHLFLHILLGKKAELLIESLLYLTTLPERNNTLCEDLDSLANRIKLYSIYFEKLLNSGIDITSKLEVTDLTGRLLVLILLKEMGVEPNLTQEQVKLINSFELLNYKVQHKFALIFNEQNGGNFEVDELIEPFYQFDWLVDSTPIDRIVAQAAYGQYSEYLTQLTGERFLHSLTKDTNKIIKSINNLKSIEEQENLSKFGINV